MVVAKVNDGVTDSERALYAVSCDGLYAMPVGAAGDPLRSAYPNLGNADTFALGIGEHVLFYSAHDFGSNVTTVKLLKIPGGHLQSDDEAYVFWRWDNADRWESAGPRSKFPILVKNLGSGKKLQVAIAYKDGSRTAIAPYFDPPVIPAGQWETHEEDFEEAIEADVQSPATF